MAGTEFLSNEQPEKAKLNQKTTYVGTVAGRDALGTTYPGQMAYTTDTDVLYVRNAANSAWVTVTTATTGITAGTETEFTGVADSTNFTVTAGHRYYAVFTLPSTEPFYVITEISWKNGTTVTGSVTCGVDALNSATLASLLSPTPLLALGMETARSGAHPTTQRVTVVSSSIIKGGTVIGVWIQCSTASDFRNLVSAGGNEKKATAYPTTGQVYAFDNTAWTSDTTRLYVTCKYKGYY